MLSLPAPHLAHLAGGTTALATLCRITRADAAVFRFTDHARPLRLPDDGVYQPALGYTASAVGTEAGLAVGNLQVDAVFDADAITEDDLAAGVWDRARVELMSCVHTDTSIAPRPLKTGRLGQVIYDGLRYTAEFLDVMDALETQLGRLLSPDCDARFGDTRCGVDLGDWTHAVTVTAATDRKTFSASAITEVDAYFDYGLITWTGGANAGRAMEIKTYADGDFVLLLPMVANIAVGDTGTAIGGCPRNWAACKARGNAQRFRGYPHRPGMDRVIAVVPSR